MKVPNPSAALGHLIEATKSLDPALSDADIAEQLGVSYQAMDAWRSGQSTPRAKNRAALRRFLSGLVDALPQAYAKREAAEVAAKVKPFTLPSAS